MFDLPPGVFLYVALMNNRPTTDREQREGESLLGGIDRNLIDSVPFLLDVATLPISITDLADPTIQGSLPLGLRVGHAVVFVYNDDYDGEFRIWMEKYPFAVIYDMRGVVSPAQVVPGRAGHVVLRPAAGALQAKSVISGWLADAPSAFARISAFWPKERVERLLSKWEQGKTRLIAAPAGVPLQIPAQRYLKSNAVLHNLAVGFYGDRAWASTADTPATSDIDEAHSRLCDGAEALLSALDVRDGKVRPRRGLVLIAPSVNPTYFPGVNSRLSEATGTPGIVEAIYESHGYIHMMPATQSEVGFGVIRTLLAERASELSFLDAVALCRAAAYREVALRAPYLPGSLFNRMERLAGMDWEARSLPRTLKKWNRMSEELTSKMGERLIRWVADNSSYVTAVSDLPLEWCRVDGVPLGYLTSIARIPLVPGNSPSRLLVDIRPPVAWTVMSEVTVLVVNGHEAKDPLRHHPRIVFDAVKRLGFPVEYVEVRNEARLMEVLASHRPELLYLSAHGGMLKGFGAGLSFEKNVVSEMTFKNLPYAPSAAIISACRSDAVVRTYGSPASRLFLAGVRAVLGAYLNITEPHASLVAVALFSNLAATLSGEDSHATWRDLVWRTLQSRRPIDILVAAGRWMRQRGKPAGDVMELFAAYAEEHNKAPVMSNKDAWTQLPKRLVKLAAKTGKYAEAVESVVAHNTFRPESMFYTHIGQPEKILLGPQLVKPAGVTAGVRHSRRA